MIKKYDESHDYKNSEDAFKNYLIIDNNTMIIDFVLYEYNCFIDHVTKVCTNDQAK